MNLIKPYLLGLIISLAFLVVGVFTLKDYGVATDSVFHYLRGQAYLNLLTTGSKTFNQPDLPSPVLIIPGQRIGEFRLNDWEPADQPITKVVWPGDTVQKQFGNYLADNNIRQSFYKSNYWSAYMHMNSPKDRGHPPVSDILAAATNHIFYENLGMLGDIEAYSFYALLTGALAVFAVYYFAKRNFGDPAAVIASLTLALYPFFFAESHLNIKDIPEMSFFACSVISFYFWVASNKKKWFAVFVLASFLAVGTKFNALFLPGILLPWLLFIRKTSAFRKWFGLRLITYTFFFILIVSGLFILFWPYLWSSPFTKIFQVLTFYQSVGTDNLSGVASFRIFGVQTLGLILVVATAPILVIVFFGVGIARVLRKMDPPSIFVLLWFTIPILRTLIPSASTYATLRQFAEFLPAEAIIAGVGGAYLISKIKDQISKTKRFRSVVSGQLSAIPILLVSLYIVYLSWVNISYHPNENLYINSLFGGTKNAIKTKLINSWQTPNDNLYKHGVEWLNSHAEKNARLAFLDGSMFSISPLWLRDDIKFGTYSTEVQLGGEYVISTYYYPKSPSDLSYAVLDRFMVPVHEIKVKGMPIIKIWKNSAEYIIPKYRAKFQSK